MEQTKNPNQGVKSIRKCHICANTTVVLAVWKCLRQTSSYVGTQYPLEDHAVPPKIKTAPVVLLGRALAWMGANSLEALFCRYLNTHTHFKQVRQEYL